MLIIFYLLLMLGVGRCTDEQIFETKTVRVGDDVELTCTRKATGSLFWMRLVSGNLPEVLAKTYSVVTDARITAREEPGAFVLHITKAKLSDTAIYYCTKRHQQNVTFLKGINLKVEGPEPHITAVPTPDPVHPENSESLPCSVLSDSENQTCCLRAGSYRSDPSFNDTHGNCVFVYEKKHEGLLTKICISFSKNISSSDAGTSYCAVPTCGNSNSRKLNIEAENVSQRNDTVRSLLSAALALSLIIIAVLIYSIKILKKKSHDCNAVVALQTDAASSRYQESRQIDEDIMVYSAPTFTSRKSSKAGARGGKTVEDESIYTSIRAPRLDE